MVIRVMWSTIEWFSNLTNWTMVDTVANHLNNFGPIEDCAIYGKSALNSSVATHRCGMELGEKKRMQRRVCR